MTEEDRMGTQAETCYAYEPDIVHAPGETLMEWLDEHDMTRAALAARTALSTKHINELAAGIEPITDETALSLERVTGVPASLWCRLEASYRR